MSELLRIVRRYVGPENDERVRLNAAAALAHIGSDEATEALVDMALNDKSTTVANAVAESLVRLGGTRTATAVDVLEARMKGGRGQQRRVYFVEGLLSAKGVALPLELSVWERARRALLLTRGTRDYGSRGRWRSALGAAGVGLVGALLWAIVLLLAFDFYDAGEVWAIAVTAGVLAAILAAPVSLWSAPILLQPFWGLGIVRELAVTGTLGLALGAALGALFQIGEGSPGYSLVVSGAALFGAAAVTARASVILLWGSRAGGARKYSAVAFATVVSAGVVTALAIALLDWAAVSRDALSSLWLLAIPVAPGVAWCAGQVEDRVPSERGLTRSFGIALGPASAWLLLLPMLADGPQPLEPQATIVIDSTWTRDSIPLMALPAEIRVEVGSARPMGVYASAPEPLGMDLVLLADTSATGAPIWVDYPEFVASLRTGTYRLRLCTYGDALCSEAEDPPIYTDEVLIEVAERLGSREIMTETAAGVSLTLLRSYVPRVGDRVRCVEPSPEARPSFGYLYPEWGYDHASAAIQSFTVSATYPEGTFNGVENFQQWHATWCERSAPPRRLEGDSIRGTLLPPIRGRALSGEDGSWLIGGRAGETVVIDVGSTDFDPVIHLVGPGLEPLQDDDSGPENGASLSVTFPQDGDYVLSVRPWSGSGSGQYFVRITREAFPGSR